MNDISGKRFGRLTVICCSGTKKSLGGYPYKMWLCKCDCGNYKELSTGNLTSANTKSCGCLKVDKNLARFTTHGESKTKLYRVWASMKDRCYRKGSNGYENYGARGIQICDCWKNNFQAFRDWAVANGYEEKLTIERRDVNGDYCPENCTWIPKSEQARNRRNSHFITYRGETKTLSEWCREFHIDRECVRNKEKKLGSGELAIESVLNSTRHKRRVSKCQELE